MDGALGCCVKQRDGHHALSALLLSRLARTGGVLWAGHSLQKGSSPLRAGRGALGAVGQLLVGLGSPWQPAEETNPVPGFRREAAAEHLPIWVPSKPVSMEKGEARRALSAPSAMADASLCPYFLLLHQGSISADSQLNHGVRDLHRYSGAGDTVGGCYN